MGSTITPEDYDYLWLECEICARMFIPVVGAEGGRASTKCPACRRGDPPAGAIDDMCEEPDVSEWWL